MASMSAQGGPEVRPAEAEALVMERLGASSRADHSRLVGRIMREYATRAGANQDLWQCVGLLHDLDYPDTLHDPARHGVAAAERLRTLLPQEALTAIAAHDHRTGVQSDSKLSQALRSADASAHIAVKLGARLLHELLAQGPICVDRLRGLLPGQEHLADRVRDYSGTSGMSLVELLRIPAEQTSTDPP